MDERRYFQRISFQAVSRVTVRGKAVQGTLMDISMKGALVGLSEDSMPELGDKVTLDMHLTSSEVTLHFKAEVVHIAKGEAGLFFTQVDVDTLTHLRRLLELNTGDEGRVAEELQRGNRQKAHQHVKLH